MRKKKKIAIIAIIVILLCTVVFCLKTREKSEIETVSQNASEEKFQTYIRI